MTTETTYPWVRYRFKTRSVADSRPLIYNPKFPSWETGLSGDDSYAVRVAYLPPGEDLTKYWDDAFDVEAAPVEVATFSSRFRRPSDFVDDPALPTRQAA